MLNRFLKHMPSAAATQDSGGERKSEPTPTGGSLPSTKEHCLTQDRPGITTKWVFLILLWAGAVAQLLEGLPGVHKALGSIPAPHKPGGVVLTCNSSTKDIEAEAPDHPWLQRGFKATWPIN